MKYKIGDKVRIKSLDWYNENKDADSYVHCGDRVFDNYMSVFCGSVVTIGEVSPYGYDIRENMHCRVWTDEMIEGLVEEETKPEPKFKVGDRVKWYNHTCDIASIDTSENTHKYLISNFDYREDKVFAKWVPESELTFEDNEETKPKYEDEVNGEYYSTTKYLVRPNGYQFVDENGNVINATKIVLEKKKKEYPKTYEECAKVLLDRASPRNDIGYKGDLLVSLQKLLVCRDAYWKIAGEMMGLGKPWEPDWNNISDKYCIYFVSVDAWSKECQTRQCPFAFPTPEMRDAFKENFDPDIEMCKEFL